jgi:glucosamine--fructose-6-phosphate aminotransferase (isomerizing)
VVVGPESATRSASGGFPLPTQHLQEALQPVLEILPLQRLAYEIAMARGQNPDSPRAIAKVTETR